MKIDIIVVYIQRYGGDTRWTSCRRSPASTSRRSRRRGTGCAWSTSRSSRFGLETTPTWSRSPSSAASHPKLIASRREFAARQDRRRRRSARDVLRPTRCCEHATASSSARRSRSGPSARRRRSAAAARRATAASRSPLRGLPTPRYDLLPTALLRAARRPGDARLPVHLLVLHRADPQPRLSHAARSTTSARHRVRPFPPLVAAEGGLVLGRQPHDKARVRASELLRAMIAARALVAHPGEHGHREGRRAARSDGGVRLHRHLLRDRVVRRRVARRRAQAAEQGRRVPRGRSRRCTSAASASWPGFIAGFDGDTPEIDSRRWREQLYEIGVDVPFLSILTPYPRHAALGRSSRPRGGSCSGPGLGVLQRLQRRVRACAHDARRSCSTHAPALWREAFSVKHSFQRVFRAMFRLRLRGLPHVRDDEPVLLPESAPRKCSGRASTGDDGTKSSAICPSRGKSYSPFVVRAFTRSSARRTPSD